MSEAKPIDHFRWAKHLKSDVALQMLIEAAADDSRLADILARHIEIGNVVQHGKSFHIPFGTWRDEYSRVQF